MSNKAEAAKVNKMFDGDRFQDAIQSMSDANLIDLIHEH